MNQQQVPINIVIPYEFKELFRQMIREELALAALKAEQKAKHGEKMRMKRGGTGKPL